MRSLAAAVLACALTDLLKGRDTAEILSWVQGRPAACRSGWRVIGSISALGIRLCGSGRWLPTLPAYREAPEVGLTPYEDVLTPDLLAACAVAFRLAWVHSSP